MNKSKSSDIRPEHQLLVRVLIVAAVFITALTVMLFIGALQDKNPHPDSAATPTPADAGNQPAPAKSNLQNSDVTNLFLDLPVFAATNPVPH